MFLLYSTSLPGGDQVDGLRPVRNLLYKSIQSRRVVCPVDIFTTIWSSVESKVVWDLHDKVPNLSLGHITYDLGAPWDFETEVGAPESTLGRKFLKLFFDLRHSRSLDTRWTDHMSTLSLQHINVSYDLQNGNADFLSWKWIFRFMRFNLVSSGLFFFSLILDYLNLCV